MNSNSIIRPLITEKTMQLAKSGWYTFEVDKEAQKPRLAKDIENQFKVTVKRIKTIIVKGKPKRTGRKRIEVRISSWKKAIVKLAKDQKIAAFDFSDAQKK